MATALEEAVDVIESDLVNEENVDNLRPRLVEWNRIIRKIEMNNGGGTGEDETA